MTTTQKKAPAKPTDKAKKNIHPHATKNTTKTRPARKFPHRNTPLNPKFMAIEARFCMVKTPERDEKTPAKETTGEGNDTP